MNRFTAHPNAENKAQQAKQTKLPKKKKRHAINTEFILINDDVVDNDTFYFRQLEL